VNPRRILIVGSGGREHALAWRLTRDPDRPKVICAPGNDGIGRECRRLPIHEREVDALVGACRDEGVDLVVVGPEGPLAEGLVDALEAAGIAAFGPNREAARIESSKWYAKQLMERAGIPTARAEAFEDLALARAALVSFEPPFVVKADGLAAGKGVRVTSERQAAEAFLAECLEGGRFGQAGRRVVIEEHLEGVEASLMAVSDGRNFVLLPAARDYKRALDGGRGANTGGMGAYCPVPELDGVLEHEVARRVVVPALAELEREGTPFRGVLYCGLMLGAQGPMVVEFNCRFGDPESQVVLPLVEGRLGDLLASAARGALDVNAVKRRSGVAVSVALVDEEYPEGTRGSGTIEGLEDVMSRDEVLVFHAGTRFVDGMWKVKGGRAVYVTAVAGSRREARERVYETLGRLGGGGWRHRGDIAAEPADRTAHARAFAAGGA